MLTGMLLTATVGTCVQLLIAAGMLLERSRMNIMLLECDGLLLECCWPDTSRLGPQEKPPHSKHPPTHRSQYQ